MHQFFAMHQRWNTHTRDEDDEDDECNEYNVMKY